MHRKVSAGVCLLMVSAVIALTLAIPLVLMWAWNTVAPILGAPQIEYWHALALYLLVGIIGGTLRGGK